MKFGLNLLLWTPEVSEQHAPLLADIKRWGYDGAELPLFDGDESSGKAVGKLCDDAGLARTAVTVCDAEHNPISPDAPVRQAAVDHLKSILDCCAAAGVETLCGPVHSALGQFSGAGRTDEEWNWGIEVLSEAADHAESVGVTIALEAVDGFDR
ncbi:MAG: TIM barrel protein, partial [Planctomycetota bacterium]